MKEPVTAYKSERLGALYAYKAKVGRDAWHSMEVKVYSALNRLLPGHYYDIAEQVPEQQQELFVKCCCIYIQEQPDDCPNPVAFRDGRTIKRY